MKTHWATVVVKTFQFAAVGSLLLAGASFADVRTWDGGVLFGGSWNSASNWSSNTVPSASGTSVFSNSNNGKTTIGFTSGATSIGDIRFLSNAPAFTFNEVAFTFNITGGGITNSSTNTQTFNATLTGKINFSGAATAGTNTVFNNTGGSTTFSGSSSAANATIKNSLGGFTAFKDAATAGSAIITSGSLGALTFNGTSSGGTAVITNSLGGATTFNDFSNAGSATIINNFRHPDLVLTGLRRSESNLAYFF